jgi:GR25 family glycosyltransferase involved in LPS biosynthesis
MLLVAQIPDAVCINLKRRPGRWAAFKSRAQAAGLSFIRRFEAIDGNELDLPDNLKSHRGAYGCLHSHAAVYKHALFSGFEHVLVTEDDCVFKSDASSITDYLTATLGVYSWIHLGGSRACYPEGVKDCKTHREVRSVVNTHAYVVDRTLMAGYVRMLETDPFPTSAVLHADRMLLRVCREKSLRICIPPEPLAVQDKALPSDVQWGLPQQ